MKTTIGKRDKVLETENGPVLKRLGHFYSINMSAATSHCQTPGPFTVFRPPPSSIAQLEHRYYILARTYPPPMSTGYASKT
jgi:hypothetical protein